MVASSIAGFFMLRSSIGPNAAILSVLPVAVVAAYFGTRWGLLATTVAFPANVFLLDRDASDLVSPFVSVSLLAVAWIFGQLHKLEAHQHQQTDDRIEQLRSLAAANHRTRELLDGLPDTVMRITEAGRIMELHGEQYLGLADVREEVLFRSVATISPEWHDDLLKLARSADETGTPRTARHTLTIDGEAKIVESRVATIAEGDAIIVARVVEGATIGPI